MRQQTGNPIPTRKSRLQKEEASLEVPVPLGLIDHVRNQDPPDVTKDCRNTVAPPRGVFTEALT